MTNSPARVKEKFLKRSEITSNTTVTFFEPHLSVANFLLHPIVSYKLLYWSTNYNLQITFECYILVNICNYLVTAGYVIVIKFFTVT